jgi:hypothetical protein
MTPVEFIEEAKVSGLVQRAIEHVGSVESGFDLLDP